MQVKITKYNNLIRYPEVEAKDLAEIVKKYNPSKYERAKRLAKLYIKWGDKFQIYPLLAWPQAMHETGFLTFKGIVPESANNFCGHGATGAEGVYNVFETEELGVIAHYSHLAWYCYPEHYDLKDEDGDLYCSKKYDIRHFGTKHRYNVFNLEQLGGKWATPGHTYGQRIADIANKILEIKFKKENDIVNNKPKFDLIIQMGHIGRTRGATGARDEQKFTKALGEALYKRIKETNLKVRLMEADNWLKDKPNLCRCFFSIHYDGSLNKKARGSSVGYPEYSDPVFAHKVNDAYMKLSKFPQRKDNYTKGLKNYYAWRKNYVIADYYCLLEHGFGTNKYEYNWMFLNIEKIADCHCKSIIKFLSGSIKRFNISKLKKGGEKK